MKIQRVDYEFNQSPGDNPFEAMAWIAFGHSKEESLEESVEWARQSLAIEGSDRPAAWLALGVTDEEGERQYVAYIAVADDKATLRRALSEFGDWFGDGYTYDLMLWGSARGVGQDELGRWLSPSDR